MSEADKLTPEEKLLKVIQGKDAPKDDGGKSPASSVASTPAKKVEPVRSPAASGGGPGSPAEKKATAGKESNAEQPLATARPVNAPKPAPVAPKPISAPDDKGAEATRQIRKPTVAEAAGVAAAVSLASGPDETVTAGASKAAAPIHKPVTSSTYSSGLALTNRCLVAAALVLVALSGYEILAAAMSRPLDVGTETQKTVPSPEVSPVGEPVPCDALKEAFARKSPVRLAPEKGAERESGKTQGQPTGWQQYAKSNLNMIGVSGEESGGVVEVVVSDAAMKKIFVVRKGDKFKAGQWEFQVKAITREQIVFERAGEEITVN
jgi:hypothetical protein